MYIEIQGQIKEYKETGEKVGEENTKQTLVLPLLYTLGYNIFNPKELQLEYKSDMRDKGLERVDYAILEEGKPIIYIEVKALGTELEGYIGQLQRYYVANKEVKYGILTDGQHYLFFTDDKRENIMDTEPFYKIDIKELEGIDKEFLEIYRRNNLGNIEVERKEYTLLKYLYNNVEALSASYLEYLSEGVGYEVTKESIQRIQQKKQPKEKRGKQKEEKVGEGVEKKRGKTSTKKQAQVIETYTYKGKEYKFKTWKEIVYNILNIEYREQGTLKVIKDELGSRKAFGITQKPNHKYSYKRLENGEYLHLNLSSEDLKKWVDRVVKVHNPMEEVKYK